MTRHPIIAAGTGIGPEGPCPAVLRAIEEADVLAAGMRLLDRYGRAGVRTIPLRAPLDDAFAAIAEAWRRGLRTTVLADGDPLCFGVGETLLRRLPVDAAGALRFIPGVGAIQEAAARIGRAWRDVPIVSLHGRDDKGPLFAALTRRGAAFVYTDPANAPGALAKAILERGGEHFRLRVFENMGAEDERFGVYGLSEAAAMEFSPLNLVLVERTAPPAVRPRFGLPDDELSRGDGVFTKAPVRAAVLSALGLGSALAGSGRTGGDGGTVFWDCGAGTGAVSLEAAAIDPEARIFALEARRDRLEHLRENIRRTGLLTVAPVPGAMPGSFAGLADPDRIFFGGGLSDPAAGPELLALAWERLRPGGVLAAACALLGSLELARAFLEPRAETFGVTLLSAGVSAPLAGGLRFCAENPVFIVKAVKPAGGFA